ncbi:MAG: hypothetical protein HY337_11920 [Gemmatimonadetes bacterium]|nr:hypothetical protein [Gemmatimonadota bacterium]
MPCAKTITAFAALTTLAFSGGAAQSRQAVTAVGHSTEESRREATVTFELSNGETRTISLRRGAVYLDGESVGAYRQGSEFDRAWRSLLSRAGDLSSHEFVLATRQLAEGNLSPETAAAWDRVTAGLPAVPPGTVVPPAPPMGPGPDAPAIAEIQVPDVNVDIGDITSEVRAAVAEARRAQAEARLVEGMRGGPSFAAGAVVVDIMSLLGTLVALASIGFGTVFFVPQRLEVVADTVAKSPVRAFFAGLFAQPLLLPALLTMVVGLILTVVGILVVPVAIVGFVLAVIASVLGGYLAVARVVGEIYVRRTGRQNLYTTGWATYRYLVYGLLGLLAIWIPALALQWIPGAGLALMLAAVVFTWIITTAGLGAVVLSRGGTRTTFGGKSAGLLSAEFSWTAPRTTVSTAETRRVQ